MIKIAITKDIERFLEIIENIYHQILQEIYNDLFTELKILKHS